MERPIMLFVEDDRGIMMANTLWFEDQGFDVISSTDITHATATIDQLGSMLDIVVADRGLTGEDCAEIIVAAHQLGIFAVVFTANEMTPNPYLGAPVVIKPDGTGIIDAYNNQNEPATENAS